MEVFQFCTLATRGGWDVEDAWDADGPLAVDRWVVGLWVADQLAEGRSAADRWVVDL